MPGKQNDHEELFIGPDDEAPNRPPPKGRKRVGRLPALPGPHVRVPIQWITKPDRRGYVCPPETRLFLYLLYRSYWGQQGVALTSAVAAEIGLSRWGGYRALDRLERSGWVRVERHPGRALVVWPITLSA